MKACEERKKQIVAKKHSSVYRTGYDAGWRDALGWAMTLAGCGGDISCIDLAEELGQECPQWGV